MKKLGALVVLAVIGLVGVFFLTGGEADPGNQRPDIERPTTGDAVQASDSFLGWLTSRPDWFWTMLGGIIAAAIVAWVFRKMPALVWLIIGGIAVLVIVRAMS